MAVHGSIPTEFHIGYFMVAERNNNLRGMCYQARIPGFFDRRTISGSKPNAYVVSRIW